MKGTIRKGGHTIQTIKEKSTKIYLKKCRGNKKGCIQQFYTQQPNKLYCSAKCKYDSILESNRKSRHKNYLKNKKRENLKLIGTIKQRKQNPIPPTHLGTSTTQIYKSNIITYLGVNILAIIQTKNQCNISFYDTWKTIQSEKRETFHTGNSKGKLKDPTTKVGPSLQTYQYLTDEDLFKFSISYLKDNKVKCPECENRQNLIEHALNICSKCGLVLKAPPIHPGFIVDDLLSKKKVAPTVQDINLSKSLSGAFELAHTKYNEQISVLDCEVRQDDLLNFDDKDPLNPVYWRKRRKGRA